MPRALRTLLPVAGLIAALGALCSPAGAVPGDPALLGVARAGLAPTQALWADRRHHWYDERLADRDAFPQATVWGAVPLFESLDALAVATPSPATRAAVNRFAAHAESYFDRAVGGFAPYPGDRGPVRTWFDDNGWWGLAFFDAFRATGQRRWLTDAQRAFSFVARRGWDAAAGGMWWNTAHPYKAGEPLAAASLLGALLFAQTGDAADAATVQSWLSWADAHFVSSPGGLYWRTDRDPTPTPYIEGPIVEARELLCLDAHSASDCAAAGRLADEAWARFQDRMNMGPQYDTIYLHWMAIYGEQTGQSRWHALAEESATRARAHAMTGPDLYLNAWDGSDMRAHGAGPGMLRTQAATVELFAWLAALPAPSP